MPELLIILTVPVACALMALTFVLTIGALGGGDVARSADSSNTDPAP